MLKVDHATSISWLDQGHQKEGKPVISREKANFTEPKNDLQLYCDDFFPLNYVRNVFSSKKKGISFHLSIARCQSTKMMEHWKYMSLADLKLTDSNLHSISDNIEDSGTQFQRSKYLRHRKLVYIRSQCTSLI